MATDKFGSIPFELHHNGVSCMFSSKSILCDIFKLRGKWIYRCLSRCNLFEHDVCSATEVLSLCMSFIIIESKATTQWCTKMLISTELPNALTSSNREHNAHTRSHCLTQFKNSSIYRALILQTFIIEFAIAFSTFFRLKSWFVLIFRRFLASMRDVKTLSIWSHRQTIRSEI